MSKYIIAILLFDFSMACQDNNKAEMTILKKALYTQQDTLNIKGFKFQKKEFNQIIDNFPKLYQEEVLHPDSLYKLEYSNPHFGGSDKQNISFDSDAGQDRYFALYAYFLEKKNKSTRFEFLGKHLKDCYENINTIFERINRGGTHYTHQYSCIPAYVAYDIYFINQSDRLPVFTKKTRAECYEFIIDLKQKIAKESKMADITYAEVGKIEDLVEKLNEAIINDYILFRVKIFAKPYLDDFLEIQKENGKH